MQGLAGLIAQVEPDLEKVADSGVNDVKSEEWLLAAAIVVGSIVLAVIARRLVERLLQSHGSPVLCRLGGRAVAFLFVTFGFIYAFRAIDVSVGPLIGGLGIVGIALAFALQDILTNFVAGVMLQTRRPITIGDQISTHEIEGEVEDVNLRAVQIRNFDGETVFVPNSDVLNNPIINWTKTPERRTTLNIGVAYDADLEQAQRILVESVSGLEEIMDDPAPEALVYEFGDSSVNFAVRFWHGATIKEAWHARDAAARSMKRALDEAGITIPFPQTTLWFGPGNTKLGLEPADGES